MSNASDARRSYLLRQHWASTPIKAQRLAAGLSLDELAGRAGCSARTIARAERGERIRDGLALRLAEALNVPVGWVFPDHPDAEAVRAASGGYPDLETA